ncbi:hypothetical protein KAR29_12585 [Aminithiophilus ramosus]|uniref:Uncharacterized protein n=2 Tax=Synergistales TaxID=649776 RepID=A0A9Q7EZE8_9BACT|nr:hypothetical protein [Aminithiophilus ramosus]QTX32127.1 hypothetical protein KAR29_12585 [Aminithiophilus ramosus]QVL35995.1 hypothetical protein KIH16_12770 [Synergistota bacterium]
MKARRKIFSWTYGTSNSRSRRRIHRFRSKAERSAGRLETREALRLHPRGEADRKGD